ncbi:hypothetical protein L0Y65_04425 [Candidatus Micrarchaeota archaeon]|nr:hypothetical protein [Candidatus Micrarchaeota archaeon]
MAESFVGIEVAVIVVTASIVLAGILVGLGRAFGFKRIEMFGLEELMQSIINAAIIGSFAAVVELVGVISSSVVSETCSKGNVIVQLSCSLGNLNDSLFFLMQGMMRLLNIVGYYQDLALDFGAFSVSPFANLSPVSDALSQQLLSTSMIMMLVELNAQIAAFIGQNALALLFPVGLVLRTFFATRKVGGFMIALAIGLYVFYPTFILVFPDPAPDIMNSTALVENFTNNSFYATVPVIDLNSNYAIAGKLDLLSGRCDPADFNISTWVVFENGTNVTYATNVSNTTTICDDWLLSQNLTSNVTANMTTDFSGGLTMILQSDGSSLAKAAVYSVIAPIFSLAVTFVFVRELANILGSEIGLKTLASI